MPTLGSVTISARDAVKQLQDADLLHMVKPEDVLVNCECHIPDIIRRIYTTGNSRICARRREAGRSLTLSLAKVPLDLQTDQTMRHLMGDFARRTAKDAGDYRKHLSDGPGLIQIQEAAQTQASQHLVNGRTRAVRSSTHQCNYEGRHKHHLVPDYGKEVQSDKKFCHGCGTKLE